MNATMSTNISTLLARFRAATQRPSSSSSRAVIDAISGNLVLGYSRGYANRLAHEFSDPADWRGRRVHILGGSPSKQLDAIRQLTQPTLTDEPPVNTVGLDWNGLHRGVQFGEF